MQVNDPVHTDYEKDPALLDIQNLESDLLRVANEFIGITLRQEGAYRWITLNETLLTTLEKWRKQPYFCPYRPNHGTWILTCKSYLQGVSWNLH